MKLIYLGTVLILAVNILTPAIKIKPVKSIWIGTVYIRADGSIDPPDAPIITYDNITYTLNDTIASYTYGIIVEKSNIVINGANHTIYGYSDGCGVYLKEVYNVTIKDLRIENFKFGVFLYATSRCKFYGNTLKNNRFYGLGIQFSSNVTVSDNILAENTDCGISIWGHSQDIFLKRNKIIKHSLAGIYISNSNRVIILKNNISENVDGIFLYNATNNMIVENNVTRNRHSGIEIFLASSSNKIYHNNFINNAFHVQTFYDLINFWDDGYPSGGNYWSDYTGLDEKRGPNQDKPGSDGIGDTPYVIDENNIDHYPLMYLWISKLHGDVNNDGKVDMTDVGIVLRAYGTTPTSPNWNPNNDINNDRKVDMTDVGITLRNFGKTE